MYNDILGKRKKEDVEGVMTVCEQCGQAFFRFKGLDIDMDDQPCPHCSKKKSKTK